MKSQTEIFKQIALEILNIIPYGEQFSKAVLEVKRLTGNVGYTGFYISSDDEKKWLNIFDFNLLPSVVHELYTITQTEFPIHTNWNRAVFTLFADNKFEIEYKWDQALQDEVDSYNMDV